MGTAFSKIQIDVYYSIMAELDVSWTQDEWTEFLAKECRIRRDNAHQIASKLAEQDFHTGKFESVVSEWQLNAKGCKEILLGIGFKDMDIFPFIAALRRHIEKEGATNEKQTQTTTHLANRKRPMCNELVWAVCKGIGVVKTSDRILLTSANIYAYLEKAFRKKLIYRDLIHFVRANNACPFLIMIELEENVEDEIVLINQKQTEYEYELLTNHLHILLSTEYKRSHSECYIDGNALENAHMHFFVRLIAPQLRPIAVDLTDFTNSTCSSAICFLRKMHDSIEWVKLRAKHLHLEPINAVLKECNKLEISIWDGMDDDQVQQFCDAFIRWINANNGGQPKMCAIYAHCEHETVLRLLDALNKDFPGATSKQPFAVRIEDIESLDEFTLSNARTREQLQLRRMNNGCYMLMRQPVMELDIYKYMQLLEWEFGKINKMTTIDLFD